MAKVKIVVPYLLRELVCKIEEATGLRLGVPMTAEVPAATEEEVSGVAKCHFPGISFRCEVRTGTGHYGQYIIIDKVSCRAKNGLWQEITMGPGWAVASCETSDKGEIVAFVGEKEVVV